MASVSALDEAHAVFKDRVAADDGVEEAFGAFEEVADKLYSLSKVKNHKGQVRAHNEATIKSAMESGGTLRRILDECAVLADDADFASKYPGIARKIGKVDGYVFDNLTFVRRTMDDALATQSAKGSRNERI